MASTVVMPTELEDFENNHVWYGAIYCATVHVFTPQKSRGIHCQAYCRVKWWNIMVCCNKIILSL